MTWKQDPCDKHTIIDGTKNIVCRCWDICDAKQIIREHNSHEALLAACRGMVADDILAARETLDIGPGGTGEELAADELIGKRAQAVLDAIKLAGDKP